MMPHGLQDGRGRLRVTRRGRVRVDLGLTSRAPFGRHRAEDILADSPVRGASDADAHTCNVGLLAHGAVAAKYVLHAAHTIVASCTAASLERHLPKSTLEFVVHKEGISDPELRKLRKHCTHAQAVDIHQEAGDVEDQMHVHIRARVHAEAGRAARRCALRWQ